MIMPRHGASTDKSQKGIIDALEKIGCDVEVIRTPCDLLVGFRSVNILLECKTGNRKRNDQPEQDEFLANWRGQVAVVRTPEEAIRAVMLVARSNS